MDRLLTAGGAAVSEDRLMDNNALEKERGITITSKYTSFAYNGYTINAVDTPGHADFGGEVERVLSMVDGAVLLVDAQEGALAQTKFVLQKALRRGFTPLVVLNKVDRPAATEERCGQVASQLFDLFASLGATDEQLDFPVLYASAKQGWTSATYPTDLKAAASQGMAPLLDAIVSHVPPPSCDPLQPFAMCVAMIDRDPYLGRIATGRIASGRVKVGDAVRVLHHDSSASEEGRITRILKRAGGFNKAQLPEACAGDVVEVAGLATAGIADTIASPAVQQALDPGHIDPPTLSMVFGPNDSPLAGRVGKAVTGRAIGERLLAEAESSVSLRVQQAGGGGERYEVQARGELQLGVLIENMRREGLELAVSPPQVLLREEEGQRLEPFEEVMCEVGEDQAGSIIEALALRKADLIDMVPVAGGRQRLTFVCPSRGMLGFKTAFATLTRGEGLLHRAFLKYDAYKGSMEGVRKGVLVAMDDGKATAFAIAALQARGTFFIEPGEEVYEGMVVGENSRDMDMEVNPCKEKKLTNVRSVEADDKIFVTPPRRLTLEDAIGYVGADELVEVTPSKVRIRKLVRNGAQRRAQAKRGQ